MSRWTCCPPCCGSRPPSPASLDRRAAAAGRPRRSAPAAGGLGISHRVLAHRMGPSATEGSASAPRRASVFRSRAERSRLSAGGSAVARAFLRADRAAMAPTRRYRCASRRGRVSGSAQTGGLISASSRWASAPPTATSSTAMAVSSPLRCSRSGQPDSSRSASGRWGRRWSWNAPARGGPLAPSDASSRRNRAPAASRSASRDRRGNERSETLRAPPPRPVLHVCYHSGGKNRRRRWTASTCERLKALGYIDGDALPGYPGALSATTHQPGASR